MVIQNSTGIPFSASPPATDGLFWRSSGGLWMPNSIGRNDISDATVYGRSILTAVDSSDLRLLLGVVRSRPSQIETVSRTLTVTDALKHLYSNLGTAFTLTVPLSIFATDDEIEIAANGAGNILITPITGFTLNGGSASVTCNAGKAGFLKFYSPNVARFFGGS